jgi:hypothetical protein
MDTYLAFLPLSRKPSLRRCRFVAQRLPPRPMPPAQKRETYVVRLKSNRVDNRGLSRIAKAFLWQSLC